VDTRAAFLRSLARANLSAATIRAYETDVAQWTFDQHVFLNLPTRLLSGWALRREPQLASE